MRTGAARHVVRKIGGPFQPRGQRARRSRKEKLFDLAMSPVDRSPDFLLDQVSRNVQAATQALGALTAVTFDCGCLLTLASDANRSTPWKIMAWNDSRCASATHQALKAKWERTNLL